MSELNSGKFPSYTNLFYLPVFSFSVDNQSISQLSSSKIFKWTSFFVTYTTSNSPGNPIGAHNIFRTQIFLRFFPIISQIQDVIIWILSYFSSSLTGFLTSAHALSLSPLLSLLSSLFLLRRKGLHSVLNRTARVILLKPKACRSSSLKCIVVPHFILSENQGLGIL